MRGNKHKFPQGGYHNPIQQGDQDRNGGTSEGCNYKFWRNFIRNGIITIGATLVNCKQRGREINLGYKGDSYSDTEK